MTRNVRVFGQAVAAIGLAHRLRPKHIAAIHCHFAHAPTTIGMYTAMQLEIPFSFVGHANDLLERRSLLTPKLKRAAFVACISTWHRTLYQQQVPRPEGQYPVIRCGVEVGTWGTSPKRSSVNGCHLLTLCRLVEKKGVDTLIRALAILRRNDQKWRLTIAGSGPDTMRLRALATHLDCNEAITWLGPVDADCVPGLLAGADAFVLPCREDQRGDRDGIPVVLMEAMAAGVPVVAGDLPSIRDLIQSGQTGILVPGNDATALADALVQLWHNPSQQRWLAEEGRKIVIEEFSQTTNIARLERALQNSLGLGSRSIGPTVQRTTSQRPRVRAAV